MIFPAPDVSPLPDDRAALAAVRADPPRFLLSLFTAMVAAADPGRLLPAHLPAPPPGRTVVVGAGKAAAAMARAVAGHWPGDLAGLVVTRYGHGLPCHRIEVMEAGHPLPDSSSSDAAERILALVSGLSADDLVLVLLSGGGSSLLTLPAPGLSLADVRAVNEELLRSGAPIAEMNSVRKHLSAITGGRLAVAAWPAKMITLAISDVPGDDPTVIASGPTVADPSTFADARAVAEDYGLDLSPGVRRHLEEARDETPKPRDPRLERSSFVLLATPGTALEAAADAARAAGIEPVVLGAQVQGEARAVAVEHVSRLEALSASGASEAGRPLLLLSGGETTVTVRGAGRGGRNMEYLLALGLALEGRSETGRETGRETVRETGPASRGPAVYALAADTDGIDGTDGAAGALLRPDSLSRGRDAGLDPHALLADNDSYGFFASLDDLVVTGPTRTNVNDFRAILVL